MDKHILAQTICDGIVAQGNDVDNLGDGESIVMQDDMPTINLPELAEYIIDRGGKAALHDFTSIEFRAWVALLSAQLHDHGLELHVDVSGAPVIKKVQP